MSFAICCDSKLCFAHLRTFTAAWCSHDDTGLDGTGTRRSRGIHAAAQDLHEAITVRSLERMAACTVRVLPVHGVPLMFAGAQQPDVAVEVCIKQHTGAPSIACYTGRRKALTADAGRV